MEAYVQDTWRVTSRLTLDYGLRIAYIPPQYNDLNADSVFVPELYDQKKAVRLFIPILVGNQRRAVDPGNLPSVPTVANTFPSPYIGLIVPNSGDPLNGIVQTGKNGYPRGGIDDRGVHWGPRFGFAYNVSGSARTVIRGGFGIAYDRVQTNLILPMVVMPPNTLIPQLFYGNLADLPTTSGTLSPVNVSGISKTGKLPTVYSFSIGVQRNIGSGTVVDAAYVSTLSRHLFQARNLNTVPYFTTFQRFAQDTTQFGGTVPAVEPNLPAAYSKAGFNFSGARALPANFLRPYPGFGEITYDEAIGSSNYNSLQVKVTRRVGHGLTFGIAYTFSKAFDTGDFDFTGNHPYNTRAYDYKLANFDRTHTFVANYIYDVPSLARFMGNNRVAKFVLGDWQVSGISQYYSGTPFDLSPGISGVNTAQRMTGSYQLSPLMYRVAGTDAAGGGLAVNPAGFYSPGVGDVGPYPHTYLRNPGFWNSDISIFKNFPIGARDKGRLVQLRLEMFNAFNQTEFSSINTGTQLINGAGVTGANIFNDFTNVKITNNLRPAGSAAALGQFFGEYNGARDPRIIQLGLKVYF